MYPTNKNCVYQKPDISYSSVPQTSIVVQKPLKKAALSFKSLMLLLKS